MQLSLAIVDFHLFYEGRVDVQNINPSNKKSVFNLRVSVTQMIVEAHGLLFYITCVAYIIKRFLSKT